MAEVDPLIFKILADSKGARKDVAEFQRLTAQGLGKVERDVLRLETQMKRSTGAIGNSLKRLAGTLGTLFTGRELVAAIDSFTRLQNSLRVAGLEGEKLQRVQGQLLDLSSRYGVGIEGLANLYGKAADAGRSFGASEAEILQLTEATSQALKITGTSAAQAQGAILGLSQALASGTVRAEEYAQINEGGLRPLLQAAAGAARFGGDINKLRAAMLDGKVTSQEFFAGIIAGSAELDTKASKAALTLAGAFEALSSRFTVYIGQSAQASGATSALARAMQLLADNLDVIIPALATIAAFMGTRMVVAAIAGSRAYAGFTAVLAGTATASATATAGLTALTAALTGPAGVALAITAVGAGLVYLAGTSERAEAAIDDLKTSNDAASDELDRMIGRLKAAGVQTDELAAAARRAKGPIDDLADAYRRAAFEAQNLNKQKGIPDPREYQKQVQAQQGAISAAEARAQDQRRSLEQSRARFGVRPGDTQALDLANAALREERRKLLNITNDFNVRATAYQNGVDLTDDKPSGSATTEKPDRTRTARTRSTADPLDAQFRNEQDLRQLQLEELRAKEQVATSATARADLARQALDLEAEMRRKDIDEAVRKKTLTGEEADARRKIIDNLYGAAEEITVQGRDTAYQLAIAREEQERLARQQTDAMRDELDALGAESGIVDVRKDRVEIERRMLEIQQQIERALLDEAIARGDVLDAAQARAALGRKQAAERTGFDRDNQGPLGQYLEDLRRAGLNLDDQFEGIAVNGLRSLNDGLADAIANSKSLGDVFKNVARQIIADLIRIAIQQTIVNALMSSGGGGGGGLFGSIIGAAKGFLGGGLFTGKNTGVSFSQFASGRASGGHVNAGQLYRINEASSPGNPEYFRPANSGTVIPLGQVNQSLTPNGSSGSGIVEIRVYGEEGSMFVPRVEAISTSVSVKVTQAASGPLINAAAQETQRRMSRPRMPGAGR